MTRILIALAVALSASPSVAGWRCRNGCYYWVAPQAQAYQKPAAAAYNWRQAITTIEAQKIETNAFIEALGKVSVAPQGKVAAQGYVGPYGLQQTQEYSSYPAQGATLYGASQYSPTPTVDRMALMNMQTKLQAQIQGSAHQGAQDTADLMSLAHTQAKEERDLEITISGILSANANSQEPPKEQHWRQQTVVGPYGAAVVTQGGPVPQPQATASAQGMLDGRSIIDSTCMSCHSGNNIQGNLDLTDLRLLTQSQRDAVGDRIDLPPGDAKIMPQEATEAGFIPGKPLNWREKKAVFDLLLAP